MRRFLPIIDAKSKDTMKLLQPGFLLLLFFLYFFPQDDSAQFRKHPFVISHPSVLAANPEAQIGLFGLLRSVVPTSNLMTAMLGADGSLVSWMGSIWLHWLQTVPAQFEAAAVTALSSPLLSPVKGNGVLDRAKRDACSFIKALLLLQKKI